MASQPTTEPTARERFLPFLLDRLLQDNPAAKSESLSARTWTLRDSHRAVVRDLTALLNTPCRPASDSLAEFPEVSRSVLNYGMPDLSGLTASGVTGEEFERMLLSTVHRFEPRVLRHGLSVRVLDDNQQGKGNSTVVLEIKGEVWATPMPDQLYLKTELDLETGNCILEDKQYG
jgi:type VI secretion system protein ImpF